MDGQWATGPLGFKTRFFLAPTQGWATAFTDLDALLPASQPHKGYRTAFDRHKWIIEAWNKPGVWGAKDFNGSKHDHSRQWTSQWSAQCKYPARSSPTSASSKPE
jgi:hypothetical protein